MSRIWLIGLVLAPPWAAASQSALFHVTGRVLSASGSPLAGAEVSVAVNDDPGMAFGRVDATGGYRITVRRGATSLLVTARMLGHAPQFRRVSVAATDSLARTPDMRLVAIAAALPAVRTVGTRALPPREDHYATYLSGDGSTLAAMSSFVSSDLTADLTGDAGLALGMLPGVSLTSDARGFSIAGLGSDQNRVAVNGVDYAGAVPRGAAAVRVRLSGYDPAISMSGGLVDQRFLSGSFLFQRGAQITLDAPALQASSGAAAAVGQQVLHPVVSVTMAGPARWFVNRYTISAQGGRRSSSVATLASAGAGALSALGIQPDSARRLLVALAPLGIGTDVGGTDRLRIARDGSVFGRFDFRRSGVELGGLTPDGRSMYGGPSNNGASTYLVAGGTWTDSHGSMLSPFALPIFDVASHSSSALLQLSDSRAFREVLLNESRSTLTLSRSGSRPTRAIPSATVLLDSRATTAGASFTAVQAAGAGSGRYSMRDWTWKTTNESQWATVDNRHTFKVVLEGSVQRAFTERDASLGAFSFTSLADFVANRPTAYSRSLASARSDLSGVAGAIGIGDKFRPTKNFGIQYGLRAERSVFGRSAPGNAAADSLFGISSGRLPSAMSLSPMAGFTWLLGPRNRQGYADPRTSITGGIRDYRGALSARALEPFASETGLARDALRLTCIGDAAPDPDWPAYAASADAIPTQCAGAVASPFAQTTPPLSLIARDYVPSHSWRAELQYNRLLSPSTVGTLGGTMAWNTKQPGWIDLNFAGAPHFTLAGEANRPVFVPESSVVASSGALATTRSRRFSAYGAVMERGSDLQSRSMSLTARLSYRPMVWGNDSRVLLPVNVAYVLSDTRAQPNGFFGTTSGDPRGIHWEPGSFSRHMLQVSTFIRIPDVATISLGMQARSGQSYTPIVSGDVNGDGQSNDRAFVFDPAAAATDTAVARGMAGLLASATSAGSCLRAQVGAIARARSCLGPWTATTNTSITLDPRLTRLYNRGSVRIHVFNVLGGLDQLLHGATGMHGWGQSAFPDPALLRVSGFDAARRRFLYAVNPQFGTTQALGNMFATPFRLSLDIQLDLVGNRETEFVRTRLAVIRRGMSPATDSAELLRSLIGARPPLFGRVQSEDQLSLSPAQQVALTELGRKHAALRESVYGAFVGYAMNHAEPSDDDEARRRFREAAAAVRRSEWSAAQAMWALLTPPQSELMKTGIIMLPGFLFVRPDEKQLERGLRQWQWYAP